jgi:hypothetical protein
VERRRRGEEGTARLRSSRPFLVSGVAKELQAAVPPPPAVQGPWFARKQGEGAGPSLSRALFLGAAARLLCLRRPDPVRRHRGEQGARLGGAASMLCAGGTIETLLPEPPCRRAMPSSQKVLEELPPKVIWSLTASSVSFFSFIK